MFNCFQMKLCPHPVPVTCHCTLTFLTTTTLKLRRMNTTSKTSRTPVSSTSPLSSIWSLPLSSRRENLSDSPVTRTVRNWSLTWINVTLIYSEVSFLYGKFVCALLRAFCCVYIEFVCFPAVHHVTPCGKHRCVSRGRNTFNPCV